MYTKNNFVRVWVPIMALILLFIGISWVTQQYREPIQNMIGQHNAFSVFVYIAVLTAAIVVMPLPVNTMLLVPLAANVWGAFVGALLSIGAWTLGSIMAFAIARRFGRPVVGMFAPLEKIEAFAKRIPKKNMFWSVVALRISFPVDILSYALGMFTHMPAKDYLFSTIIGISPFAFLLAYAGTLPLAYQISAFVVGITMIAAALRFVRHNAVSR